jgi:CheY-like chemotaxis protein
MLPPRIHRPLPPARSLFSGRQVLLIDRNRPTRKLRATVLRSRGVEVHDVGDLADARFVWEPNFYDLVLLDVRRYLAGEALEFYERIKEASPQERFAFLVGPPAYLSLSWPAEANLLAASSPLETETAKRFVAAA